MYKKIFSIFLAVILVVLSVSVLSLCVSAETLAAGVYPYAVNGATKEPIVKSSSTGEVYAYNDFLVKRPLDNLTNDNATTQIRPYNSANLVYVANNKTLITASLEDYSATNDNVYGTSGKSLKLSYVNACNTTLTPPNSVQQYYHYVRISGDAIDISGEYKDTLSVGFWVKTPATVHVAVRLALNTTGTESFVVSDRITIPAGESFVEIPLSNFKTIYAGFNDLHSSGKLRVYATDIYFRPQASFTDTRDIWFDNVGFYYYSSNSGKALHSSDAIAKNSIENYVQDGDRVLKDGVIWNADTLGTISVCNPTSGAANANAYNGSGQSLKYTTTNVSVSTYNRFRTNGSIYTKDANGTTMGLASKIAVWVKTDRAIKIYLTADDSTSSNTGKNRYRSNEYILPAGESILEIPLSDFDEHYVIGDQTADYAFKWDYLGSLNIYFKAAVDSGNKNATVWVDNIAILPDEIDEGPVVPDTKVTHDDGFVEAVINKNNWKNNKADYTTVAEEENAAYSHSGKTNLADNTKALKVTYSNISSTDNYINFYYDGNIRINHEKAPYIFESDSVLSFWVRADQPITLSLNYMDYDTATSGAKKSNSKVVNLPAGESIVKVKMSELVPDGAAFDYKYVYQLQLTIRAAEATTKTSGEIYFDAFGFYDADPTNDTPAKPKPPAVPDTVVKHELGFSEVTTNIAKWVTKKTDNVTFTLDENAAHYHQGKTNVAANTGAIKVAYKNLSATTSNVSLYYDDRIQLSNSAPYTYGEDSILSFWVYTDQAVKLAVTYMDYSNDAEKATQCGKKTIALTPGENIVKIPMKDLAPANHDMGYRYAYQLQLILYSNDDTFKADGNIWFDAFGFYDAALVINDKPLDMPKNSFIWWDFDDTDDIKEALGNWAAQFAGEGGLGIQLALENSAANVYGGKGNSIKVTYNRALAQYNIPAIRLEQRIATVGDGLLMWVKSEERANIKILAIDATGQVVKTNAIPVTIGYNIVNVKWSDFVFNNTELTGKPDMSSIYQLQVRPDGNTGTLWLDQIGFSNVKNDGSAAYNSLMPPTSYKGWNDGFVSNLEDFESWPADDDLDFCTYWYFSTTGVMMPKGKITLEKDKGNTYLKMAFDQSDGKTVSLDNITSYTEIDPKGGISFWAKSSEKRYYTLKLVIGGKYAVITFMGDVNGRTYNIPFSALWENNRPDKPFVMTSTTPITISRISIISDATCNIPGAVGKLSDKFSLCLDDIKFVDGKSFVRAGAVDYTENGVNLKADKKAFTVGIFPNITKTELTAEQKQPYLKESEAKDIIALYNIRALDNTGKELIPQAAITLTFDVPEGVDPNQVGLYQVYIDGSLSKRNVSITEDGKITTAVYRIGEYILTIEPEKTNDKNNNSSNDTVETDTAGFPWLVVVLVAVAVLIAAAVLVIIFVRKGRGK